MKKKRSEVKWWEDLYGSEGVHYFEIVVLLFNFVIYVSLLLCLCVYLFICSIVLLCALFVCKSVLTTATGCQHNCS